MGNAIVLSFLAVVPVLLAAVAVKDLHWVDGDGVSVDVFCGFWGVVHVFAPCVVPTVFLALPAVKINGECEVWSERSWNTGACEDMPRKPVTEHRSEL